jgi:4,5-dihydroxyphthalate decarboxylase
VNARLRLTLAIGDYDHVRDLTSGFVQPDGIDVLPFDLPIEEIFWRQLKYSEFDVTELSLGMYTSLVSRGDGHFVGIPVFPSRVFRHAAIFVRKDSAVSSPEELYGKRVGLAQWSQTAATFVRGIFVDRYNVRLADIDWVQAGVNEAGREDPATLKLPPDIRLTPYPHRALDEMLVAGEIDAIISARSPKSSLGPDPKIVRLFANYVELEQRYFAETGIFPIMHLIAIKRAAYEANPWIARSLYKAFDRARARSRERLIDSTASRIPVPWLPDFVGQSASLLGPDPFAYGIEPNRTTLEAFMRYTHEQGVAHRLVRVEELFAPEMQTEYRV